MKKFYSVFIILLSVHNCIAQLNPIGSYDSCGAAIQLTVNATCITGGQTYMTTGATKSPQPTLGFSNDDDVWFKFTTLATQTHASIQISDMVGGMGTCMELWSGCNATAEIESTCSSTFDVMGLTPNTTYWIRVYTNGTFATLSSFKICVANTTPPPPAPNNECSFATAIPVGTNAASCNIIPITNQYATASTTVSTPTCITGSFKDVWVKFTPTSNGTYSFKIQDYTTISGSSFPTYFIATYSGTNCNTLSLINCNSYLPASGNDYYLPGNYTSGTTYYVRILCDASIAANFNVCIKPTASTTTFPLAADSTCLRATQINASANNSAAYTQGTTNGIRITSQLACFGSNAPNALAWYKFSVPSTGDYYVDFSDLTRLDANAFGAGYRILKRTTCYTTGTDTIITRPPTGTYDTLLCAGNLNGTQAVTLTQGTQYFITVMENSYNGGRVAYKLRVIGKMPPINDDSAQATVLVQDVNCTNGNNSSLRFSTLSTQPTVTAIANSGGFTQDVWYKFTAATTTVNITVSLPSGPTRIVVYNNDGSIKYDPTTNSNSIAVNNCIIGNKYLIRVLNAAGTPVGPNADFKICVFGLPSYSIASTVANCTNSDAILTSTNSNTWLHFTRGGSLTVSVFDGPAKPGFNFIARGNITTAYYTNTGGIRLNNGTAYLDRNFEISDGGNNFSNSPVRVRFYFTIDEFNNLITASNNAGISSTHELKVYRIPSTACNTATTAGGLYYNIDQYGFISNPSTPNIPTGYFVDLITPNFSGFFLQQAAQNLLVPAICNAFTYIIKEQKVALQFSTKTEINSNYFEIERSTDGINFSSLSRIEATNNSFGNTYQFIDATVATNSIYFYRLKQVDKDGSGHFICNTLKVHTIGKQQLFGNAYPNPVKNILTIDIKQPVSGKVNVQIMNALGQLLEQYHFNLQPFDTQLKLHMLKLNSGIYTLKITSKNGVEVKQITKL